MPNHTAPCQRRQCPFVTCRRTAEFSSRHAFALTGPVTADWLRPVCCNDKAQQRRPAERKRAEPDNGAAVCCSNLFGDYRQGCAASSIPQHHPYHEAGQEAGNKEDSDRDPDPKRHGTRPTARCADDSHKAANPQTNDGWGKPPCWSEDDRRRHKTKQPMATPVADLRKTARASGCFSELLDIGNLGPASPNAKAQQQGPLESRNVRITVRRPLSAAADGSAGATSFPPA